MIKLSEILDGEHLEEQSPEIQLSLCELVYKMNIVRSKYGKPMTVTSGFRTTEHHCEIYKKKAALKQAPFLDGHYDDNKVPKQSKHLYGQAVDISDKTGELKTWIQTNIKVISDLGFYFEDFSATSNWVHFQIVPPKSGSRFFLP